MIQYSGEWKQGSLQGRADWLLNNGVRYSGRWDSNRPSGDGFFVFPHGSAQFGSYKTAEKEENGSKVSYTFWEGKEFQEIEA
jgi:hypothetical protein